MQSKGAKVATGLGTAAAVANVVPVFGNIAAGILGLGSAIAGIFTKKKHAPKPPPQPTFGSFEAGSSDQAGLAGGSPFPDMAFPQQETQVPAQYAAFQQPASQPLPSPPAPLDDMKREFMYRLVFNGQNNGR